MRERLNWWWFFLIMGIMLPVIEAYYQAIIFPLLNTGLFKNLIVTGLNPFIQYFYLIFILLFVLVLKLIAKKINNNRLYYTCYTLIWIFLLFLFFKEPYFSNYDETLTGVPRRYYSTENAVTDNKPNYTSLFMKIEEVITVLFIIVNYSRIKSNSNKPVTHNS